MATTTLRLLDEEPQVSVSPQGHVALEVGASIAAGADRDPNLAVDLPLWPALLPIESFGILPGRRGGCPKVGVDLLAGGHRRRRGPGDGGRGQDGCIG
ncbi:hypothetical protein, partial [uncultured Phenylobacterium sp.]|uniref:hypothetical protein n=1 Tax=uncultured Phenylobacterium sp. TaxID=349273 RepID=UPI0025FB5C12